MPTPAEKVQLPQTTWSRSLLQDIWHNLIDGRRQASSGFTIPIWSLAPTASWLNIKILQRSKAKASWLNNQIARNAKQRGWALKVAYVMFWRSTTWQKSMSEFFCALSRCQQTSSRDGEITLFAFSPTVSVFWHLFPPWLMLAWAVLTRIADEHMQKRTQLLIHTIKEG